MSQLRVITPAGTQIDLLIPNDLVTASQIQSCLQAIDAGKGKACDQMTVIDVVTLKGKIVKVAVTKEMKVDQVMKMINHFDSLLEVQKEDFWVSDLKKTNGRYHTKKGCMTFATKAITMAQILQDKRNLCNRCQHRDAALIKHFD